MHPPSRERTFEARKHFEPRAIERSLLLLAALFLFCYSMALTLSAAARVQSWDVEYRIDHWIGFAVWCIALIVAHLQISIFLPERDPFIFPTVALLSGWGLLTIWRLSPYFGARQTAWMILAVAVLVAGLRLPRDLGVLRRYKYLWLSIALLLTAATLLLGVNPLGFGPRMWLGCCGIYLQPSEPLKLLLIAYLAAYVADLQPFMVLENASISRQELPASVRERLRYFIRSWGRLAPLLAPTVLMTGAAMILLAIQRDLGTAIILLFLYAAVIYLASSRRSVVLTAILGTGAAALLGYRLYDLVRLRIEAWLNPWIDPAGRSYQIVQSIIAVANGGIIGRGPGMGSPALVPLSHSDLIFSALAEETGLVGVLGLLVLIGLLAGRGLRVAMRARNPYHRYLAAGVTALLAGQSLLIIGGNLRLLPLTGVTLPFLSYGGSSLLTSFMALLVLLHASDRDGEPPAALYRPAPFIELGSILLIGLLACGVLAGWWSVVRSGELLARSDNQRRYIADRYTLRGSILDQDLQPITVSQGEPGLIIRQVIYPDLSNLVGYTHPVYGQAGIEASMDSYLRGLAGRPADEVWINHILYSQPPPGLNVRLSLNLDLQRLADSILKGYQGAMVALNASSGEIIALSSHPTYDANRLDQDYETLIADTSGPLFNRAVLGRYPLGELEQSLFREGEMWFDPNPLSGMRLPGGNELVEPGMASNLYSPVQVALAAAALSNGGMRPTPVLVEAVQTPDGSWLSVSRPATAHRVLSAEAALELTRSHALADTRLWLATVRRSLDGVSTTWAVAGTLPQRTGDPYVVVVHLEGDYAELATTAAVNTMEKLMGPMTP